MLKDKDLDSLRSRPDYSELLLDLANRPAPPSPRCVLSRMIMVNLLFRRET